MPAYATSGTLNRTLNPVLPAALWPGDSVWLLGTYNTTPGQIPAPSDSNVAPEAVVVGERSLSASLAPRPGGGAANGVSVLVIASANPGAAEIDVQTSPQDSDGTYATPTGSAAYKIAAFTGPLSDGTYMAYAELQPLADNFVSLQVIANPNSVKWAAKLSYV